MCRIKENDENDEIRELLRKLSVIRALDNCLCVAEIVLLWALLAMLIC